MCRLYLYQTFSQKHKEIWYTTNMSDLICKKCVKCGISKHITNFYHCKFRKDKLRARCKECDNLICKERRIANKEKYKTRYEQYKPRRSEQRKERRKNDINFRIKELLRSRFTNAMKGLVKNSSVLDLIGKPVDEFKTYISAQFTPAMSWENIELDHIIPVNYFDHRTEEQIKQCWHWSNFQPLIAEDNTSKNDNLPSDFKFRHWIDEDLGWVIVTYTG